MAEQPEDLPQQIQDEWVAVGLRTLDWMDAWHAAWEALDAQGIVDGLGSMEYRRLTAAAWEAQLPICQTAMRQFIYRQMQRAVVETITQLSLRKRGWERNQKMKGEQGDN